MTTAAATSFQHEALLYEGRDDLVDRIVPFVRAGVRSGEPVMVAVTADKIRVLRDALGPDADGVRFEDMAQIGRNPARIIPAWHTFLAQHGGAGRPVRGVGEPVWSGRSASELVECQLHEALLNVAFAHAEGFQLLCPYDTATLGPAVLHEAHCSHPAVRDADGPRVSRHFRPDPRHFAPDEAPLRRPPLDATTLDFDGDALREVRDVVGAGAERAGLRPNRRRDVVIAVHELATNSVRHGGGLGVLRVWVDEEGFHAEVRDRGRIRDPLAGRRNPSPRQVGGWGLWIANSMCDLVQVRTADTNTVVRVLIRRD